MKFKEIYKTMQETMQKETDNLIKTYEDRIKVFSKNGMICAMDLESDNWINANHAYLWDLEVMSNEHNTFIDSDGDWSREDYEEIHVDCESEKDGAMKVIEYYGEYINMAKLLNDLDIDSGNFYRGKVGAKKLSLLINTLKQSPIKIKNTAN